MAKISIELTDGRKVSLKKLSELKKIEKGKEILIALTNGEIYGGLYRGVKDNRLLLSQEGSKFILGWPIKGIIGWWNKSEE